MATSRLIGALCAVVGTAFALAGPAAASCGLSGYSYALDTKNANPAAQVFNFGQPTQRVNQTFGSGGPRAFQLGARFSF